ncbi:MAG: zinc ABC transporter substrate-binding protein [Casimicrobiaceae bacterium]
MKKRMFLAACAALALVAGSAHAVLNVFATTPEWGSLATELGGDKVGVYTATNALQDPHHVEAKPSLIARARNADLVIATGAELEIGWLPLVLQQAGNPRVRPGQPGYFEAAPNVPMIEKPARLDRADGDVHPLGNPHVHTDPRNIARVAGPLAARLAALDPPNAAYYEARVRNFDERWQAALGKWNAQGSVLRGMPIVVQHKSFSYLVAWLGMKEVATLEPKPGVEPTVNYLSQVLATLERDPARMVLRGAYQSDRASQWIAQRVKINVVTLPFTVGGDPEARDLFSVFDDTLARLLKGAQ